MENMIVKITLLSGLLIQFGSGNGQSNITRADSPCLSNPCIYGICLDDDNGTFHCYCIDGFTGFLCQTNWDECWSDPCMNGGSCIDGIAEYNCTCPQGYQGDLCEHNIDECNSNPCRNNGTCLDGSNGYTCICSSGYSGTFCETDVSVCNDTRETRCKNGGLCTEGPGLAFNCICPAGWSGQLCEESINECASSPCQNGAVCLDLHANYMCACPFGFSGRNCEAELEICGDSSPCQNGALCLLEDWLRVCYCVPDYHGDRCQYRYNECLLGPGCKNGGTCIDGVDGYDCSCLPGWSGNYCECLIVDEGSMRCDNFLSHGKEMALSPKPHQTMPKFWTENQVPKTTPWEMSSVFQVSSTKARQLIPPYPTECFPIWPHYTVKTTKASIPKNLTTSLEISTIKTYPKSTTNTHKMTPIETTTPVTPIMSMTKAGTTAAASTSTTAINTPSFTTVTTHLTSQTFASSKNASPLTIIFTTPATTTTSIKTTYPSSRIPESTISTFLEPFTTPTPITTPSTNTYSELTIATYSSSTITAPEPKLTTVPSLKSTKKILITSTTESPTSTRSTNELTSLGKPKSLTTESQVSLETWTKTTEKPFVTTAISTTSNFMDHITQLPSSVIPPLISTTRNCKMMPCYNGGFCLNTTIGPRCICKSNWEGSSCEKKNDIKIAGFSKNSYVSHRLTNTQNIDIELIARTISPVGIILYSHLGYNIFMTLYLENGLLKFKFSCGIQMMVLSEVHDRLHNGKDFAVRISLNFLSRENTSISCLATVRLNNTISMSGEQSTGISLADSGHAWVYIGGVPTQYFNLNEIPTPEGFVGCMHDLRINGEVKGIFKDSFESVGVSPCKFLACLSNPCQSGSTCKEYNDTWTCLCPSGFSGSSCQTSVCENNPCQFGGTCVSFPGSGFLCLCPLGKQGLFCESNVDTSNPLFASSINGLSSFAAYKIAEEIYQDFQLTFKFVPYDMEQISLMLFLGQDGYHGPMSDHLAVSFIKGYIVLTWNLGSGPRRIFTSYPVPNLNHLLHTVKIGRTSQRAWLVVDNQKNVTGKSPGKLTQLNTRSILYLGGHASQNFSHLPHDLPLHTGFSGCLFDVELKTGQKIIKIDKSPPAFGRGVGQCGQSLCNERSCENGGGCISHGATFTCLCSEGWFGPTCSSKYNQCDSSRHNCSEGSTCVPLKNDYFCDCPVGKTGHFCEKDEDLSDVKFKGIRSYVALSLRGAINQYQSCIELEIRPLNDDGLILYSAEPERNSFLSLSLQNGMLELRISTGVQRKREIIIVKSGQMLTLKKWHRIRIGRYGRRLYLWVEGTVNTELLLPDESIPFGATVYLGGAHDLSKLPVEVTENTLKPFEGCIRKFRSQWKTIPLTKATILNGRNVEDCDGTACGGDVCHNGGTCYINSFNVPICACLKQYTGKKCEYKLSCQQMNCQNGGRCEEGEKKSPQCYCPNGWSGPFCESAFSVNSPRFGGNSYLMIDKVESVKNKKRNARVDLDFIRLNFTTPQPNGFILWSSSESSNEFIGIGVEKEKMKFVWAWKGHNTTIVNTDQYVADGIWHDLTIKFDSPNITIWMDQHIIYNTNDGYPGYPPSTDGKIFLGGFPDTKIVANRTLDHFKNGFDGCLQQLSWTAEFPILNFSKFKGENIEICDLFGT